MGLNVCAVVCDQELTQWKCLRKLGASSDRSAVTLKLKDENEMNIPVFLDVPHCIKNMRNALQKYAVHFTDGDRHLIASWSDILRVAELELGKAEQLRLVPKLRDCHVNPTVGKKMSVRLAAQVFSRTMFHPIAVYCEYGLLVSQTATGTARFCQLVNDLFDMTNKFFSLECDNE
jgi:hypothetical protein